MSDESALRPDPAASDRPLGPLLLDEQVWSQRTFLERFVNRHFSIREEADGGYAWVVRANSDEPPASLFELRDELEPLGWLPRLESGDPLLLVIDRIPTQRVVLSGRSQMLGWAVVAFCLAFVGGAWIARSDDSLAFTDTSVLIEGLFGFALPMLAGIWLASEARRITALRRGVRLRPLLPFALPFPLTVGSGWVPLGVAGAAPIWPFGIIAIIDPRRVDLTPHPDRSSLAWTSLAAPITLLVIGTIFEIIGLILTPDRPAAIDAPPFMLQLNPMVGIIAQAGIGESLGFRVQWVSSLALAGHGLSMLGWILMLPIPNFPGDHLIAALVGPSRSLDSGHQTMLFGIMMLAAVGVFISSGFWPWLLLVMLGAVRRFQPDLNPVPLVLDEWSPIEERQNSMISVLIICILLLGFPGWTPLNAVSGWQDGFSLDESWPEVIEVEPGEAVSHSVLLAPAGVLERDGWLWLRVLDEAPGWTVEWQCGGVLLMYEQHCFFTGVSDHQPLPVTLVVVAPAADEDGSHDRVRVQIWLSSGGTMVNRTVELMPMTLPRFDEAWTSPVSDDELLCANVTLGADDSGNISSITPGWSIDRSASQVHGPGVVEICLRGPRSSGTVSPRIELLRDNGSTVRLGATMDVDDGLLTVGGGGALFAENGTLPEVEPGSLIAWVDAVHCPPAAMVPNGPATENWTWDLSTDPMLVLPSASAPGAEDDSTTDSEDDSTTGSSTPDTTTSSTASGSATVAAGTPLPGRLLLPDHGLLVSCSENGSLRGVWRLAAGPDAALVVDGLPVAHGGLWFGIDANGSAETRFSVRNAGNTSLTVRGEMTGDPAALELIAGVLPIVVAANSTVPLDLTLEARGGATVLMWSEVDPDGMLLHLVARCDDADCGSGSA